MVRRHLRHEAGGDPAARGPVPELATELTGPQDLNEFPDVPRETSPTERTTAHATSRIPTDLRNGSACDRPIASRTIER